MVRRRRLLVAAIIASLSLPQVAAAADDLVVGNWNKDPLIEREVEVAYDVHPELKTHTIIRPARLQKVNFDMPVLLWENGACTWENRPYRVFLERIAATGTIVLAKGNAGQSMDVPRPPGTQAYYEYVEAMKAMQREALDWIIAENGRPGSPYHRRIDTSRVAAMGYSCGGFMAVENAAVDDRIDSVLMFNSSTRPEFSDDDVQELLEKVDAGTPIGIFNGGPSDIAHAAAVQQYANTPDDLPALFANWQGAGHGGFWSGDGSEAYQPHLAEFAIHWLELTLVSGRDSARDAILGDPCVLCDDPAVTVQRKNWDAFVPPQGPPRAPLRR